MSEFKTLERTTALLAIIAALAATPAAATADSVRSPAVSPDGIVDPGRQQDYNLGRQVIDQLSVGCIPGLSVTAFRHPKSQGAGLDAGRNHYLGVKLPCRAVDPEVDQ
jgi:hypothetical protein